MRCWLCLSVDPPAVVIMSCDTTLVDIVQHNMYHKNIITDNQKMEEYAAEMEKHERQRQEQVEALKVWQAKQEQEAKARPEAKRWIDPAIIDRRVFEVLSGGPCIVCFGAEVPPALNTRTQDTATFQHICTPKATHAGPTPKQQKVLQGGRGRARRRGGPPPGRPQGRRQGARERPRPAGGGAAAAGAGGAHARAGGFGFGGTAVLCLVALHR
jgi:hypothetical protein